MKTILIVDDHEIVRSGLKMLINGFYPFVELQESHTEESTVEILKKHKFDLLILDKNRKFSRGEYLFYILMKCLLFSLKSLIYNSYKCTR